MEKEVMVSYDEPAPKPDKCFIIFFKDVSRAPEEIIGTDMDWYDGRIQIRRWKENQVVSGAYFDASGIYKVEEKLYNGA